MESRQQSRSVAWEDEVIERILLRAVVARAGCPVMVVREPGSRV
jgi:hypothetical protein